MADLTEIKQWAWEKRETICADRHYLHAHPETAYHEYETAAYIRKRLGEMGIPFQGIETGTVADIPGGMGNRVALRADIDALPISEPAGLEYASLYEGRMHACGHDTHTAMLLGAAAILWEHREKLPGPVRLIFQPAEEGGGGALHMIDGGCLEDVSSIYCLHAGAGLPVGCFTTRPGLIHAASDGYQITVHGRACHGSVPHQGVDAIVAASHIVLALQEIVSRETDTFEQAVLTIGSIHGGTARNILCDSVLLDGTLRTLNEDVRVNIKKRIVEVCEQTAAVYRAAAEVKYVQGYCTCKNDPAETEFAVRTAQELWGKEAVRIREKPSMGGEDFGFYEQRVPGCKLYIGTGCDAGLHEPEFDINEDMLPYGAALLSAIAFGRYRKE